MKSLRMLPLMLLLFIAVAAMAKPVDNGKARQVATTFLNNNGAKTTQLTDLSKATGFSNLYIFTSEQSFVVMSADDCVKPILGYSLTGNFVADNMPDNLREWLQGYNDEIQYAIDHQMRATAETTKMWKDLMDGNSKVAKSTVVVAPLIQTKWNQNKYYNRLCPAISDGPDGHAYTGCMATAMAQIMKYYNYPLKGIGSHSYSWNDQTLSADFGATTYDWNNMLDYYEYYFDNDGVSHWLDTPSSTEISAVATLMYHCGVSVNMSYSSGGSGAGITDAAAALKTYFNYSTDLEVKHKEDYQNGNDDTEWKTMVKNELDALRPLPYVGSSPTSNSGHAFVCDGYDDADYFHFNWGWAGHYDGYFSLSNLDTGANSSDAGAGNGVYTRAQQAIFGIQPVQCAAAAPTNLTYTLSGIQNITLNWTAANGAASYNIYRNNSYVGSSTTNTFAEVAPFGTDVYYVRSVDANGELSLSSNYVTVTIAYQTPIVDDLGVSLSGNDVSLTWTAPEWCYPEAESALLNYGVGDPYYSWTSVYYGHRHLAADLAQYAGKAVYKVSTFIKYPGTYSLYIYTKSTQYNRPDPNSLVFSNIGVSVTVSNDWYEFIMDDPIILSGTDDLWVVMKQENTGQEHPTPSINLPEHNINAFYAGSSPTSLHDANSNYNCAWLINTYLTDGVYTYNVYRDGTVIAGNVNGTSYSDNNLADGTYTYYVKTNYYGGETAASNQVTVEVGNNTITQMIELDEGWNWFSPYVKVDDPIELLQMLKVGLGENAEMILSMDDGMTAFDGEEWFGDLDDFGLANTQMYMILTNAACTVEMEGEPANVTDFEISIKPGWNWIGFPSAEALDVENALAGFAAEEGDILLSQDNGLTAYDGEEWFGDLETLAPGVGLMYYSSSSETKTLVYSTAAKGKGSIRLGKRK